MIRVTATALALLLTAAAAPAQSIGGSVRVEMGKSSRSGFGTSTGALVQLEGRGESTLGPVRGVLRMRGQLDRGLDSGSYNYR